MSLRPRTAFVAAVLIIPGTVLAATPANAVTGWSTTTKYIGGGGAVNVRNSPTNANNSNVVRSVPVGTPLDVQCQTTGTPIGIGTYAANRTWDKLSDGSYIHDVVTTTPGGARTNLADGGYVAWSPGIPQCVVQPPSSGGTSARVANAVAWAQRQVNQPGWGGRCEAFVETAYGVGYKYYSANTDYQEQRRLGRIHTDANAPAGALVYYGYVDPSNGENLGHVALSIGGGQAIGTFGAVGSTKPTSVPRQHAITGRGLPYLGWASAPDAWAGR